MIIKKKEQMEKTRQIYNMILIKLNGWSKEDVENLDMGDVEGDPIYEGIKNILDEGD